MATPISEAPPSTRMDWTAPRASFMAVLWHRGDRTRLAAVGPGPRPAGVAGPRDHGRLARRGAPGTWLPVAGGGVGRPWPSRPVLQRTRPCRPAGRAPQPDPMPWPA